MKFSDEEERLIVQGHRHGMEALLASPDGQRIDPRLHKILLSGKLAVRPRMQCLSESYLQCSCFAHRPCLGPSFGAWVCLQGARDGFASSGLLRAQGRWLLAVNS